MPAGAASPRGETASPARYDMSDNRKVMLVANPVSGKKAVANALSDICRVFLELGWIPSVFVTGGRGDATDYVKKYGGDFGRIVAIGGDGTMNETVTGIIEAGLDTPFAFIPSGTTNDFASTHHLPTDMIEASRLAAGGKIRMLDACRFNERYFMFHCGCGFFAGVVNDTYQEMKNALGYFAYILEGMSNALSIAIAGYCSWMRARQGFSTIMTVSGITHRHPETSCLSRGRR